MQFSKGNAGVSWEFFEAMAKAFHEWRALHPYADPRLLAETLREQVERATAKQADADVIPHRFP
jgi:hypothetical protein